MINGEKAAYCTPFAEKKERALGLLLKDVEQKCGTEVSTVRVLPRIIKLSGGSLSRSIMSI